MQQGRGRQWVFGTGRLGERPGLDMCSPIGTGSPR